MKKLNFWKKLGIVLVGLVILGLVSPRLLELLEFVLPLILGPWFLSTFLNWYFEKTKTTVVIWGNEEDDTQDRKDLLVSKVNIILLGFIALFTFANK